MVFIFAYGALTFYKEGQPTIKVNLTNNKSVEYNLHDYNFQFAYYGRLEIIDKKDNRIIATYYSADYLSIEAGTKENDFLGR